MDTWGDKPKSQMDPELIEEAVARAIANHANDPDSHLEEGQSLKSHKASEIIDHLAFSIVNDKIENGAVTNNKITSEQIFGKDIRTSEDVGEEVDGVSMNSEGIKMWQSGEKKVDIPVSGDPIFSGKVGVKEIHFLNKTLISNFESLDGYNKTNRVSGKFGNIEIKPLASPDNIQHLTLPRESNFDTYPDITKNPIFNCTCAVNDSSGSRFRFGLGSMDDEHGIGFRVTGGALYFFYTRDDELNYGGSITGVDPYDSHMYRIEVKYNVNIKWYVDDALKITRTWAQLDTLMPLGHTWGFIGVFGSAGVPLLVVSNVIYQQD